MDHTHRLNLSAGIASVGTALFLVGLKLWALVATGSLSVAASLADSGLDVIASGAGLIGILYAAKPPDDDHSFGHTSIEDLVALGQSVLVAASAVLIGWKAYERFDDPQPLASEGAGLLVMGIAMATTVVLVIWQGRVARRTGSKIVAADRLHYLSDLLPNFGAIIALFAASQLGIYWLDPLIAIAASIMLLFGAQTIGVSAWDALMDRRADPEMIALVEETVAAYPGVMGFHDLRTRTAGARIFIQVHLELNGDQSLREAHAIAAGVRRAILGRVPTADVIIHQDPV